MVRLCKSDETKGDKHIRILFFGFSPKSLKSQASRMYIPMIAIRNMLVCIGIVMASRSGQIQAAVTLGIYCIFVLYSFCCCPYNRAVRIFLHIHEFLFIVQLLILTISCSLPEVSRVNNALFLLFFNYSQTILFLLLALQTLLTLIFPHLCQPSPVTNITNQNV